jgi:hypothetical protein
VETGDGIVKRVRMSKKSFEESCENNAGYLKVGKLFLTVWKY